MEIIELDVCGQICPSSLLTALKEVNLRKDALRQGSIQLDILTDNHDSTNRVSEAISNMGYAVTVADQKHHYRISISKRS